jgi:hypothetical protein
LSTRNLEIRESDLNSFGSTWSALQRECSRLGVRLQQRFIAGTDEGPIEVQTATGNPFATHPGRKISKAALATVMTRLSAMDVVVTLRGVYGYRVVVNEDGVLICTGDQANHLLAGEIRHSLPYNMFDMALEVDAATPPSAPAPLRR